MVAICSSLLFRKARQTILYLIENMYRISIVFLIEAQVEVWESEKCCGNTGRSLVGHVGTGVPAVSSAKR